MFDTEIRKFRELFTLGISAVREAARIYVRAIDANSLAKREFARQMPEIPAAAWDTLEQVGRGLLHERLLLLGGRVQDAMKGRPLSAQTDAIENGVDGPLHDGTVMRMKPENMVASQLTQVFGGGSVRSIAAQRAWMESRRSCQLARLARGDIRYRVEGCNLIVLAPVSINADELRRLLAQMK